MPSSERVDVGSTNTAGGDPCRITARRDAIMSRLTEPGHAPVERQVT
ncbi:hypothetical protein [Micromonospora orduensis]|nr:hypothetical protein [Micromonospora orduensis]